VTFAAARAAVEAIEAAEQADDRLDPVCRTRFMSHGDRTRRAIVLLHGFTNCPKQFVTLGQQLFERGYTVYIPRLPGHGLRDKLTNALRGLSVVDFTRTAHEAAELATGLGERVHVAGISLGGMLAAWLGERMVLTSATAISPFFAIANLPMWANTLLAFTLFALPNFYMWWDPVMGPRNTLVPPQAYARYPSRLIAEQLRLSARVQQRARREPPLARVSCLFINAYDISVNNAVSDRLYKRWVRRGATVLRVRLNLGPLRHDIIDDFSPKLPVDLIYPRIIELLERADALAS